jgi:hypothetical protein
MAMEYVPFTLPPLPFPAHDKKVVVHLTLLSPNMKKKYLLLFLWKKPSLLENEYNSNYVKKYSTDFKSKYVYS